MTRRLFALPLLFYQVVWLAPAGLCPRAEPAAYSRAACHDARHAGTALAAFDGSHECTECHVPACRSASSCAAVILASEDPGMTSIDLHASRANIAETPRWRTGDLAPPLPPPPEPEDARLIGTFLRFAGRRGRD